METVRTDRPGAAGSSGLMARAVGMIVRPRPTLGMVVARPRWVGMLALTVAIATGCAAAFLVTESGQTALLDQQVRTLESFGQAVDDAAYERMETWNADCQPIIGRWDRQCTAAVASQGTGALLTVSQVLAGLPFIAIPALSLVVTVLLVWTFGAGPGRFRTVFAVVVHAGAILALQQLVVTPLNYARESISSATNLAVLLPMLDEGSMPARFLGMIDLFIAWWIVALAVGISLVYERRAVRVATGLFAVYVGVALVLAVVMVVAGGV